MFVAMGIFIILINVEETYIKTVLLVILLVLIVWVMLLVIALIAFKMQAFNQTILVCVTKGDQEILLFAIEIILVLVYFLMQVI